MDTPTVKIITDGSVAIDPDAIKQLEIEIVRCQVRLGKETVESNIRTPLPTLLKSQPGPVSLETPHFSAFFSLYDSLRQNPLVSIHPNHIFSETGVIARTARNVAYPNINVKLFEAQTIDLGTSYLVKVAAQAAKEGFSQSQIITLLTRLQQERIDTFLLKPRLTEAKPYLNSHTMPATRLKDYLSHQEYLFTVDKKRNTLTLIYKGSNVGKAIIGPQDLLGQLESITTPTNFWIRQWGYDKLAEHLAKRLSERWQADLRQCRVQKRQGLCPLTQGKYLELVTIPPDQAVTEIKNFARSWSETA